MTPDEIKKQFHERGETFCCWAEQNGYRKDEVYAVLNGRLKARRGRAHEIAVKLGLKSGAPVQRVAA